MYETYLGSKQIDRSRTDYFYQQFEKKKMFCIFFFSGSNVGGHCTMEG